MSTGNYLFLDIGTIIEKLGQGSTIPISLDTADSDIATDHQLPQIVARCFCRYQVSMFTPLLRSIDTSQSDLFSGAAGAGVSVVATSDVNLI